MMTRWSIRKRTFANESRHRDSLQTSAVRWTSEDPAVILAQMPPFNDLLISTVSSKVRHEVAGFDELVRITDRDFPTSGLKVESLIRLGLIATIPATAVMGELGSISPDRLTRLRRNISQHLNPVEQAVEPGDAGTGC